MPLLLALGCSQSGLSLNREGVAQEQNVGEATQGEVSAHIMGAVGEGSGGAVAACLADWRSNSPCGAYCKGQTQADRKNCQAFLDCYKNHDCGPSTCGAPDQICGVNVVVPKMGSAPRDIANLVYECMACPGTTPTVSCFGKINTTPCTDGNACTANDKCQNNVCVKGPPVTCTALDQCHIAGTCNPATGCSNPTKPDGSSCDDGNVCTASDSCLAGVCTAGPVASPSGLTATAGSGQIALAWTAFGGATTYNVQRSTTNGGPYEKIASVTDPSYIDTSISCGVTYYYVVSVVAACGETAVSNEASGACVSTFPSPISVITPTTTAPAFTPEAMDPVVQAKTVTVDIATIKGPHNQVLGLALFPNAVFRAVGTRVERNGADGWVWVGQVENQPHSLVTISVRNSVVSAGISAQIGDSWHTYRIRFAGNGVHMVQETKLQHLINECELTPGPDGSGEEKDGPIPCPGTETGESIDVMVGYTPAVRTKMGGADAAQALVYESVADANTAYLNSGITTRLRIVDVREFPFVESGSMTNDDVALRLGQGGFSGVEAIRNSHGADLRIMLVDEGSKAVCGATPTPGETVSTANESYANSVVQYDCAADSGYWSLAHEVGHQQYGLHDWYVSSSDNKPYHYNHGYVDKTNKFYSMMAYATECRDSGITCDRIAYFSSPDVKYNDHPTGLADDGVNAHPADMVRTIKNTVQTLANYRCSSPDTTTVWMRDTWNDTGKEPDPATSSDVMHESPYIWVRNSQDTSLIHQHEHENPIYGQANWVYVRLHNGGSANQTGNLRLYYANASSGLRWPDDWAVIDQPSLTINQNSGTIAEIQWPTLPGTGHFCLLAKWDSPADPPVDSADIDTYVRNNNNVVWHNVNIVSGSGEEKDVSFDMLGRGEVYAVQIAPPPSENNGSFLLYGQVVIQLDPMALDSWVTNGMLGSGFQFDAGTGTITVNDPAGAVLEGIDLPWNGYYPGVYPVALHITRPATTPARKFHLQATQYMQSPGQILDVGRSSAVSPSYSWIGGVTYELTP